MARKTVFSNGLAEDICTLIASECDSMSEVAQKVGVGESTIWRWLNQYPKFRDDYLKAKEMQATRLADTAITVARESLGSESAAEVAAHKLVVDTIKWKAKTLVPGIYGDKRELKVSGLTHEEALDLLDEVSEGGE